MNAYSKDLRLSVLAAVDRGYPQSKEGLELFGGSFSTIKRLLLSRPHTRDVNTHKIPHTYPLTLTLGVG
jgi:hypothetical protein